MDAITLEDVDQIAQACIDLDWDVVAVDQDRLLQNLHTEEDSFRKNSRMYHRQQVKQERLF